MLHQVIAALRSRVEGARKVTHDSAMRRIRKREAQRDPNLHRSRGY